MPTVNLAPTAREKIVAPYIERGQPHEFRSTPVSVAGQMRADIVAHSASIAFVVFAPQEVKLARKGIGDDIQYGRTNSEATEAETNLQKGGSTDGARDMAIEGIQLSGLGTLLDYYGGGTRLGWGEGGGAAPDNERVVRALNGESMLVDPFGLVVPPQLQSPYLLEDTLFVNLMRLTSLELKLDTSRPFNMGCARLFPGSAGASLLRSTGEPLNSNVFSFPEGILWQRDGKADSDLAITLKLQRELVMPISPVTLPGGSAPTIPLHVYQRIGVDLLGVSVSELAVN